MSDSSSRPGQRLRILWVNCRLLHPLNGGDRIRTYNMLKQLKRNHHITYLCFQTAADTPSAVESATEFCHELITVPYEPWVNGSLKFFLGVLFNSLFSKVPFFAAKYRSAEMERIIKRLTQHNETDLVVADYLASMIHFTGSAPRCAKPLLIFQHNVESQIWKRHTEAASNPIKRAIYHRQWRLTCRWELDCDAVADGQVSVSADDCKVFREELGLTKILGDVPTGVDLEFFSPSTTPRKPNSLVFLGSMDWMANIDGTLFFVQEILPLVRVQFPDVSFTIVGRNPPPRIKQLEEAGIRVTGTVDDVRPYLAEAAVMVVPLRVGGGTRIKIFEGMASGIPVVSTRIGAEGLPVTHGKNILLADSPQDQATQIISLFKSPDKAETIGADGRHLVETQFGWSAVNRIFENYCQQVCSRAPELKTTE